MYLYINSMPKTDIRYQCPRCGYETHQRSNMRKHFYGLKKMCPGKVCVMDLTDEIREHVLNNRIYTQPKTDLVTTGGACSTAATINNIQFCNNFIANMPLLDKVSKFIEYTQQSMTGYEDMIRERYERDASALDNNPKVSIEYASLEREDMLNMIETISRIEPNRCYDFCIMGDQTHKCINLYQDGVWEELREELGVRKIITTLRDYYLISYEHYLVRKIISPSTHWSIRTKCEDLLREFYTFLSSFGLSPSRSGDIQDPDADADARDHLDRLYQTAKAASSKDYYRQVVQILYGNTKKNLKDLNKHISQMFRMDENFKQYMIDCY